MKVKNLRWFILSLVALATVINYIDRNALGVMWPEISKDLGMDKDDYATIIFSFTLAYAIGQSAFGKIFDAIGTRLGFVLSIVIWSVSIALHAVAKTLTAFALFRFTMGFGEAGNWPGATKANAEWFPASERAFAQGVFNSGAAVGAIVSIPLTAFLFGIFGWKATFVVIAAFGLVWIIPWVILYKGAPASHPWLTDEEREYILSGQKKQADEVIDDDGFAPGWFEMLTYKKSWSVILSRFFLDPVWWLFIGWLPIYLTEKFGFNVKEIGIYGWVPYVGALLGALFGGWLSGYGIKNGWGINKARKVVITLGGVIMFPALIFTAFASTPLVAVLLMAVILFGFQTAIGNIQTLPSDFYAGKSVASLAGVSGTAAVLSVLATTKLVPVITAESYVPFFLLGAALVPLAMLSIWIFAGNISPVTPRDIEAKAVEQ
ncbi:MFS transporter [Agarilytica rhodophyticola]|uniref:MFS transporter n=1 Tax=Agarilytica rhodophyticola TaxID=1737490 RepID=UPI000B34155E|nr:MFS transporter [Agarilytica rhodophyticola]